MEDLHKMLNKPYSFNIAKTETPTTLQFGVWYVRMSSKVELTVCIVLEIIQRLINIVSSFRKYLTTKYYVNTPLFTQYGSDFRQVSYIFYTNTDLHVSVICVV